VLLARRITNPLRHLVQGAEEVGGGNLDYRLGMQARNEIGVASRAFDHMTEELKATLVSRDDLASEVAERTRAEGELRESNEYLDNLFNHANAPIIVWNPEFRITRFNRAFEALTGRKAEAVIGESLDLLFPADQVASSMDLIHKTMTGERWEAVEIPILHLDGSVRTVLWSSAALFAPDGTTPVATIAQGQDITERKHAEEALLESARRQSALFESMQDGLGVVDAAGVFQDVNPALCAMTGFSREELVGAGRPHPFWPPEEFEAIGEASRIWTSRAHGLRPPITAGDSHRRHCSGCGGAAALGGGRAPEDRHAVTEVPKPRCNKGTGT